MKGKQQNRFNDITELRLSELEGLKEQIGCEDFFILIKSSQNINLITCGEKKGEK